MGDKALAAGGVALGLLIVRGVRLYNATHNGSFYDPKSCEPFDSNRLPVSGIDSSPPPVPARDPLPAPPARASRARGGGRRANPHYAEICRNCGGGGKCPRCNGAGTFTALTGRSVPCRSCNAGVCRACNGTGSLPPPHRR
jgi:hypothetical protein